MLVLGSCVEGVARAFLSGNNSALLHDTLAESGQQADYMEHLGRISSMLHIGYGSAAVVGGLLAAISFPLVMWLSVVPVALAVVLSFWFVEPRRHTEAETTIFGHLRTSVAKTVQNPRLLKLSAASILGDAIGESAWLFRSAFLKMVWPLWALGIAQMLSDGGAALGYYFAGPMIRRFGALRLLIGGAASGEVINLFSLLYPTAASPILMSLNSGFHGIRNVAMSGLMQREFTDEQRATMGSLTAFAGSLAFAVVSFLFGLLADWVGVIPALLIATIVAVIPMWLTWQALRGAENNTSSRGEP